MVILFIKINQIGNTIRYIDFVVSVNYTDQDQKINWYD